MTDNWNYFTASVDGVVTSLSQNAFQIVYVLVTLHVWYNFIATAIFIYLAICLRSESF